MDQPKVSALVRGRLAGFSLDRVVRFLVLLGSDVEIVVKPRTRAAARARVVVAGQAPEWLIVHRLRGVAFTRP
jgi:hypothetical protein